MVVDTIWVSCFVPSFVYWFRRSIDRYTVEFIIGIDNFIISRDVLFL